MIKANTPEPYKKLEAIGFEKDEITTIQMIHELKTREYSVDIIKLINQIAFDNLSKGITETFEKRKWSEEDFFEAVENYRRHVINE
jgi:hypothetical protein